MLESQRKPHPGTFFEDAIDTGDSEGTAGGAGFIRGLILSPKIDFYLAHCVCKGLDLQLGCGCLFSSKSTANPSLAIIRHLGRCKFHNTQRLKHKNLNFSFQEKLQFFEFVAL